QWPARAGELRDRPKPVPAVLSGPASPMPHRRSRRSGGGNGVIVRLLLLFQQQPYDHVVLDRPPPGGLLQQESQPPRQSQSPLWVPGRSAQNDLVAALT